MKKILVSMLILLCASISSGQQRTSVPVEFQKISERLFQLKGSCSPCTIHKIIPNTEVVLMRCLEICMTGKLQHIILAHAILADGKQFAELLQYPMSIGTHALVL